MTEKAELTVIPESLVFSDKALSQLPEVEGDIQYDGWVVHSRHIRPVGAYVLVTVRVPAAAVDQGSPWFKTKQGRKATHFSVPISFVPVVDSKTEPFNFKCGSYDELGAALGELSISAMDSDFERLGQKYEFSSEFLRECFRALSDAQEPQVTDEWRRLAISYMREKYGPKVNLTNAEAAVEPDGLMLFRIYSRGEVWHPVFAAWNRQSQSKHQEAMEVIKANTTRILVGSVLVAILPLGFYLAWKYLSFDVVGWVVAAVLGAGVTLGVGMLKKAITDAGK